MPELRFEVKEAMASGAGGLSLRLAITNAVGDESIHSIALAIQLQIEPGRRRYTDGEKRALNDLFGEPSRWATTVRPMCWTTLKTAVSAFAGHTEIDLAIPAAEDGNAGSAKYMDALESGEVPITLLFSGRVLYVKDGSIQMSPIPWSQEATFRIPVSLCKQAAAGREAPARGTAWV